MHLDQVSEALLPVTNRLIVTRSKTFSTVELGVLSLQVCPKHQTHDCAKSTEGSQSCTCHDILRPVAVRIQVACKQMRAIGQRVDHRQRRSTLRLWSRDCGGHPGQCDVEGRVDTEGHQEHGDVAAGSVGERDAENIAKAGDGKWHDLSSR